MVTPVDNVGNIVVNEWMTVRKIEKNSIRNARFMVESLTIAEHEHKPGFTMIDDRAWNTLFIVIMKKLITKYLEFSFACVASKLNILIEKKFHKNVRHTKGAPFSCNFQ